MTVKRISTFKNNNKVKKLKTEDTKDYTKLLTLDDIETVKSGDDQDLDNYEKPKEKPKVVKKKEPKVNEDNKLSKKYKGKSNDTITGIF